MVGLKKGKTPVAEPSRTVKCGWGRWGKGGIRWHGNVNTKSYRCYKQLPKEEVKSHVCLAKEKAVKKYQTIDWNNRLFQHVLQTRKSPVFKGRERRENSPYTSFRCPRSHNQGLTFCYSVCSFIPSFSFPSVHHLSLRKHCFERSAIRSMSYMYVSLNSLCNPSYTLYLVSWILLSSLAFITVLSPSKNSLLPHISHSRIPSSTPSPGMLSGHSIALRPVSLPPAFGSSRTNVDTKPFPRKNG